MNINKFSIIWLLFVAGFIFTTGCKKDNDAEEETKTIATTQQKILGRWNLIKFIEETQEGNKPPEVIENDPENIYFEFFTNGIVKTNAEGEDEYPYSIKTIDSFTLDGFPQKITKLTDSELVFGNSATEGNSSYKQTYILTR